MSIQELLEDLLNNISEMSIIIKIDSLHSVYNQELYMTI